MRQDVNEIKKIVDNHPHFLNSIIADMFKVFNFKTLCWQAGAKKQEGYSVPNVIMILLMLPFMMVTSIGAFYGSRYIGVTDMKKDMFYRLQNMERMPWRPLLYGVAKRFQALANPEKEVAANSAFVLDDTVDSRVGRRIENSSRVQEGNAKRARKWNTRYFEVVVHYEGVGDIKLYICRFPYQKKWRVFLSTDPSLSFAKMMEVYSVRWTIEVFFREAKQQLRMGKCQSRDFDAQIASMTFVCILHTMLSYYRRVHDYETLGGLFLDVADDICEKNMAERLWELFEELLLTVVKLISESGVLDLTLFKDSPEYQYLKSLFEESFLSKQIKSLDSAC